ncbi:MAG: MFS transporter [Phycisphaerales bacterium]|nr:MFS transporter [Phycisphaerales bacterium]
MKEEPAGGSAGPRGRGEGLLARLVLIREGEGPALVWSAGYFFCLLFSYYLLRPYRDEMGIRGDLDKLPWLWTGTTAAMLLAAPVFAWLVSRLPRRRFIPIVYHFFAANLAVFYVVFLMAPAKSHLNIGYAFYIWLSVFNLFAVSVFWGFMADMFTTEQGKRLFGAIGIGGTLGAICGSAVPAKLVKGVELGSYVVKFAPVHLLIGAVVFLELAVVCVWVLTHLFGLQREARAQTAGGPRSAKEPGRGVLTGLILISRSPYLLSMCLYMLLFTVTGTFLWFEQARIIKAHFADPEKRIAFLGMMDLLVNIIALFTQLFITGRLLMRLGVLAGLLLLPLITMGGFGLIWFWPVPAVLMAVQVGRRGLHYAVDRPTREVLYTVLGPEEKYKSKSFIDTFVYRGGDLLGAWTDLLLGKAGLAVAGIAIGLSVVWAGVGVALGGMQRKMAKGK